MFSNTSYKCFHADYLWLKNEELIKRIEIKPIKCIMKVIIEKNNKREGVRNNFDSYVKETLFDYRNKAIRLGLSHHRATFIKINENLMHTCILHFFYR